MAATQKTDNDAVCYFGQHSPFNNFHVSNFIVDDGEFVNSEQYIHNNIKVNNIDYYSSNAICNLFGDYFANIGKKVAKKIPTPRQSIDKYIDKIVRNLNTLYLFPTISTEILWLINYLPNKTSSRHDELQQVF